MLIVNNGHFLGWLLPRKMYQSKKNNNSTLFRESSNFNNVYSETLKIQIQLIYRPERCLDPACEMAHLCDVYNRTQYSKMTFT